MIRCCEGYSQGFDFSMRVYIEEFDSLRWILHPRMWFRRVEFTLLSLLPSNWSHQRIWCLSLCFTTDYEFNFSGWTMILKDTHTCEILVSMGEFVSISVFYIGLRVWFLSWMVILEGPHTQKYSSHRRVWFD